MSSDRISTRAGNSVYVLICEGNAVLTLLAVLHRQRIVHTDLKPENVMFSLNYTGVAYERETPSVMPFTAVREVEAVWRH